MNHGIGKRGGQRGAGTRRPAARAAWAPQQQSSRQQRAAAAYSLLLYCIVNIPTNQLETSVSGANAKCIFILQSTAWCMVNLFKISTINWVRSKFKLCYHLVDLSSVLKRIEQLRRESRTGLSITVAGNVLFWIPPKFK